MPGRGGDYHFLDVAEAIIFGVRLGCHCRGITRRGLSLPGCSWVVTARAGRVAWLMVRDRCCHCRGVTGVWLSLPGRLGVVDAVTVGS